MDFNPDQYLADKGGESAGFDPDAYLSDKSPAYSPMDPHEPGLQDVSIPDAMAVQGVAGLAKALPGLAASGAKAILPSTTEEILTRGAANNMLKGTGASLGQIRQLGPETARETGLFGLKKGMADIFSTNVGNEQKLKAVEEATGKTIGGLRQQAGPVSGDMAKVIEDQLTKKYASGLHSGEQGSLARALEEVKNAPQTHADLAKKATELNQYAAGNKMTQPVNAITDVANKLSAENNAEIVRKLGSGQGKEYVQALEDYPKTQQLKAFFERGEAKEAMPHGAFGNLAHTLVQPIKNAIGYKGLAKGQLAAAEALKNAPSLGQSVGNIAQPSALTWNEELADFLKKKFGGSNAE